MPSRSELRQRLCLVVLAVVLAVPGFGAARVLNPFIMAAPALTPVERAGFLAAGNPGLSPAFALQLALLYEEEADAEGVSPDLAFAQMCLETSFLRYGNQVKVGQWNFAGLGAVDGSNTALSFSSPREGVRAQIQHLKFYACTLPLALPPVNPRLGYVVRGIAPTAWQLSKNWASDPEYGKKLMALMQRMLDRVQPQS